MADEHAILYGQTSCDPERQYTPLVLAQAAVAMDLKPTIAYLGQGLRILMAGEADKIQVGSFPNLREMLDQTMAMGVTVMACEASKRIWGLDTVEFIDGVTVIGAATLNDVALDAGATIWF